VNGSYAFPEKFFVVCVSKIDVKDYPSRWNFRVCLDGQFDNDPKITCSTAF